jgi:hypothetical protein
MNMNEGLKKYLVGIKYFKGSAFRGLGLRALRLGLRPSGYDPTKRHHLPSLTTVA